TGASRPPRCSSGRHWGRASRLPARASSRRRRRPRSSSPARRSWPTSSATWSSRRRPAMTDRFTLDVLREAFLAVADEMFVSLQRTSQSPVIYEVLDFGVGLTDARGELVSQGNGIAGFLGPLGEATRDILRRVPDVGPGDVVATNDPYAGGGTHLSDVALVRPIFAGERLVALAAAKAHWTEVGGKDPGSWTADSTEIFQVGLPLPFFRFIRSWC